MCWFSIASYVIEVCITLGLAEAELAEGRADVGHEGAAKRVCDGVTTGKLLDGV